MDSRCEMLRHTVATLAYRVVRALDGAPDEFAHFEGVGRRPDQILAHMGDLFDWALSIAQGRQSWHDSKPLPWPEEKARFFRALEAFDSCVAKADSTELDRLFQGPVADALTHVGQLAMMRRLAGCPVCGENFFLAPIVIGKVGPDQPPAVKTFG